MNKTNNQAVISFILILAVLGIGGLLYFQPQGILKPAPSDSLEASADTYNTVYDSQGNIILETALPINVEDEFISEDNHHYIVTEVQGRIAHADLKNPAEAIKETPNSNANIFSFHKAIPTQTESGTHVVIYSTHSDESYYPTSQKVSEPGNGDIYNVSQRLAEVLTLNGISVTLNKTPHDPHDINAYNRSRRTLTQLLKEQPDAAFDVHRDSAPSSAYLVAINGVLVSKAMIVVGRSNPRMQTNLEYAQRIKQAADEVYPGLIRGIFIGRGNYNQDLYPTALLFEIGTDSISQDLAERAATCLADVLTISVLAK